MKNQILIATTNQGKFNEIMEVLEPLSSKYVFLSLNNFNITTQPVEDGKSYIENAKIKAQFYNKIVNIPTIAEDSGVEIIALKNELGIHTRRWGAGENASDKKWIEHLIKTMKQYKDKRASFKCTTCFIDDTKNEYIFTGECHGVITETLESPITKGIPLSSCFIAHGCTKVYNALDKNEKNNLSHRGIAMKKLYKHLQ